MCTRSYLALAPWRRIRALSRTEAAVCFKLYRNRKFGAGHMLIDNLTDGFPSHAVDDVKEAIDDLVRDGVLRKKKSKHGDAVSIQTRLRLQVYERIREHEEFAWLPK